MPGKYAIAYKSLLLWLLAGLCCLALGSCGGNRVRIDDNAKVLNTQQVHSTATNLSKNVSVYTFNDFHGRQSDFYPQVVSKFKLSPNTVLMVIDTVHPSIYILRGAGVNLSRADISQATGAFTATYQSKGYTGATIAALNSLQGTLNANHSSPFLPLLWLIPLVLIVGAIIIVMRRARARRHSYPGEYREGVPDV